MRVRDAMITASFPSGAPAVNQPTIDLIALRECIAVFRKQKRMVERVVVQLSDEQLRRPLDKNTNSISVIMKHLAGNMRSRWRDFLTSDGEKPDRHRDNEFIDDIESREALLRVWEDGWRFLFGALDDLGPQDLAATVHIRGEPMSAFAAIARQIDHYGYHVGQIVQLGRHLAGDRWEVLTIPRGASEAYNRNTWVHPDQSNRT
jgi:hypothetical protein